MSNWQRGPLSPNWTGPLPFSVFIPTFPPCLRQLSRVLPSTLHVAAIETWLCPGG